MNTSDRSDDELSDSVLFGTSKPAVAADDFSFLDPPQAADEVGRLGNFRVLRVLGKGGMGVVFAAEDVALQRPVALKVLRPELTADKEHKERFLREARAVAALTSDHVVTIYQVGTVGQTPFMTMPLMGGMTLLDRLERPPRLDVPTALLIARQVAAGLADAHERGLVHRDVKPANIWLETGPDGAFKRVRLLDFGLARRAVGEPGLTSTGIVLGTPNYMSPEQARGEPLDPRADLFSLGCVLYVMLTGELAFPGQTTMAVFLALANHVPPAATVKNPAVPAAIADLVARLMAKAREDRPQSAAEVIAVLDGETTSGQVVLPSQPARPPAPPVETPVAPEVTDTLSAAQHETQPGETSRVPVRRPPRGRRWVAWGGGALTALLAGLTWWAVMGGARREPIKVGVLHSLTGTMASSESPVVDATLLAIDELNKGGGVLGRPVQAVVADGKSDPATFAAEAGRLIGPEKVAVIFGCWTSASRKAVRDVVERESGLLFYPVQYEGLEQSPRIAYLGPTPNQQILPALDYLTGTLGKKRIALMGSDYVFPRAAHEVIKDWAKGRPGVTVVAEEYLLLGTKDVAAAVAAITAASPDLVVNTINGGTNYEFFKQLRAKGLTSARVPVLSVSISENELQGIERADMAGDYLTASYFQVPDGPAGQAFADGMRAKHGESRPASDMMVAAYTGVHLWAAAAMAAGTVDPDKVLAAVRGREIDGPGGVLRIDEATGHAWRPWRLGQVQPDGTVQVVAGSAGLLDPAPFPPTRPRTEWERFLRGLSIRWNNQWQAPDEAKPAAKE